MFQLVKPSYKTGFAPRDGLPRYPSLWTGCAGAWNACLGSTGGVLRDWSGRKNTGTLTNFSTDTGWATSQGYPVMVFDGSDDYVQMDTDLPDTTNWAISAWCRWNGAGTNYSCAAVAKFGSNTGMGIACIQPGKYSCLYGNNVTASTGQYVSASNELVHIVAMYDGTNKTLWANGIQQTGGALDTGYGLTGTTIGRGYSTNRFSGQISDVRMYTRTLSANEIRLLATRQGIAYEMQRNRLTEFLGAAASGNRRRRFILGVNQ